MGKTELTKEMPDQEAAATDMEVEWRLHDTMEEATTARGLVRMTGPVRVDARLPWTGTELRWYLQPNKTCIWKA